MIRNFATHIKFIFKKYLNLVFDHLNYILLPKIQYKRILRQRAEAISRLVSCQNSSKSGLACIIFSKDRALQLHALLKSYFNSVKNPAPVHIIYTTSSKEHKLSYKELEYEFSSEKVAIRFILESDSFKRTLLSVLKGIEAKSFFFLVDDIVFIDEVDFLPLSKINTDEFIFSLRLSPCLDSSYTLKKLQRTPVFERLETKSDFLIFDWFKEGAEWSYPWSVDGHIFSVNEVIVLLEISKFSAPNSLEIELQGFNDLIYSRRGMCFTKSKILNLPINRVQNEVNNLSGNISSDFLLKKWQQGFIMDIEQLRGHNPKSTHEEHAIHFKLRDSI